jgi:hypothetical protein
VSVGDDDIIIGEFCSSVLELFDSDDAFEVPSSPVVLLGEVIRHSVLGERVPELWDVFGANEMSDEVGGASDALTE